MDQLVSPGRLVGQPLFIFQFGIPIPIDKHLMLVNRCK